MYHTSAPPPVTWRRFVIHTTATHKPLGRPEVWLRAMFVLAVAFACLPWYRARDQLQPAPAATGAVKASTYHYIPRAMMLVSLFQQPIVSMSALPRATSCSEASRETQLM